MRLINADKLIERIIKDCSGFHPQGYHTCKYDIVGIINQCDTDYDVDKVVEHLECESYSVGKQTWDNPLQEIKFVIDEKRAIEIVEKGGKE